MENRSHALVAGLFTLLFSIAAAVAVWWLGQSKDSTDTYILETRKNVSGLNIQAAVRYRGIRAGKVESIEPASSDPRVLQVRISLDSRFKLTKGATAELGYQGVTGLAYVQIEDDGEQSELLVGTDADPPRLPLRASLFNTLGAKADDIVNQINAVSTRLARVLDEKNAQNISRTLENLATASDGLRDMPKVMASAREALSDRNIQSLRQILANVEKTSGEAAPLATEMREMVKSMSGLSKRLDHLADVTGNELTTSTLPRANTLLREMTTSSRQLSRILESLEKNPQMLIFGRNAASPGPGESGFSSPAGKGKLP